VSRKMTLSVAQSQQFNNRGSRTEVLLNYRGCTPFRAFELSLHIPKTALGESLAEHQVGEQATAEVKRRRRRHKAHLTCMEDMVIFGPI